MKPHATALLILISAGSWGNASGQDDVQTPEFIPFKDILSFCAPLVFPKIFQDVDRLREYVRSEEFQRVRSREGDLLAIDSLFEEALRITWRNPYESLLISFISTIDHRRFGTRLPLVGSLFWFPLTSEFPDEFEHRVRTLPSRIYPDSPDDANGDHDKLQHFFGSAFLTYAFESMEAADRVGNAVELGEEAFIVNGRFDERDLRANSQGRMFGATFLSNRLARPSDFLLLVTAWNETPGRKTDGMNMQDQGFQPCALGATGGVIVMEEER